MSTFLDTNVLLRHLLNDDPVQSPAGFALIAAIEENKVSAWTSDLVIAEGVFVLANQKTYNLSREAIRDRLLPLLHLRGLKLPRKRLYDRIFELYTTLPIADIDCYHAALIEGHQPPSLYSYDSDFDQVPTITRLEPAEQS